MRMIICCGGEIRIYNNMLGIPFYFYISYNIIWILSSQKYWNDVINPYDDYMLCFDDMCFSYLKSKVQRILPILTPGSIWSGILCERENILLVKPEPICKKTESVYDSAHDCGNTLPDPQALIKNLMSRCVSSPLNTWPVLGLMNKTFLLFKHFWASVILDHCERDSQFSIHRGMMQAVNIGL